MPVLGVAEALAKRQADASGEQIPTVAIVLLSLLAIILAFGIARVVMQSMNREATIAEGAV